MSLDYFTSCRKKYNKIIQYLNFTINIHKEINSLSIEEIQLLDTEIIRKLTLNDYDNLINQKELYIELKDICDNKIKELCNKLKPWCCDHIYLEDDIDINPDCSQRIVYCTLCEYTMSI